MRTTFLKRAKEWVHKLAYLSGLSARKARSQRCVRFLMFHEVGGSMYPLDVFEEQLEYMARHFDVCDVHDVVWRLRNDRIVGNELVLTFDDGLESHATHAYPVLQRFRLPAAFFVCPGLINSREGIWTLETRSRLSALPPVKASAWLREVGAPDGADVDGVLEWMKGFPPSRCRTLVDHLRHVLESESGARQERPAQPVMSWDELRRLDPTLVTIGSHSLTHPTLPLLEGAELEREIRESREQLEERLGRSIRVFCYPDGAHNSRVVEVARRYYDAALTTVEGLSRPGDDLHALERIPAAPSPSLLAWRLHRPTA